jgi:hypothetical protein
MRVIEPGGDAAEVLDSLGRIEPALAQAVGEASSGDVLHDHVGRPQVLTEVVHVHDVRVAQLGNRLRLMPEPRRGVRVRCDRLQDLDRAGALELGVIGAINETHRPLADEILDFVLPQLGPGLDRQGSDYGFDHLGLIRINERRPLSGLREATETPGATPRRREEPPG